MTATSRAVVRANLDLHQRCDNCGTPLPAKKPMLVCNVYENGTWQRVERWHPTCYTAAGEPYGTPVTRLEHSDRRWRKCDACGDLFIPARASSVVCNPCRT